MNYIRVAIHIVDEESISALDVIIGNKFLLVRIFVITRVKYLGKKSSSHHVLFNERTISCLVTLR